MKDKQAAETKQAVDDASAANKANSDKVRADAKA